MLISDRGNMLRAPWRPWWIQFLFVVATFSLAAAATPEEAAANYEEALALYGGGEGEPDYDGAARLAKAAAQAGHAKAQVLFGYMHSRGQGARSSWSRAAYWWKQAADQGYAPALFNLSTLYWFGIGVREDYGQARVLLERLVDSVSKVTDSRDEYQHNQAILAESYWRLGVVYQRGYGVARDGVRAARLMERAAVAGHYQAMLQTGLHYALGEVFPADTLKADLYLNMALNRAGEVESPERRSFYLEGIERDDQTGEGLTEIGQREGQALAYLQMTCGITLFNKSDREGRDMYSMAGHWLRLAAEADQAQAKTYLGALYLLGLGVEEDFSEAARWLREGAEAGMSLAAYYYAIMLDQGLGMESDPDRAARYFIRAERSCIYPAIAAAQNPAALLQTPARLVEYTRAAAAHDLTARACYGFALTLGFGLAKDPGRGLRLLRECAEAGSAVGQFALAQTLLATRGPAYDRASAFALFEKAATQGHIWAKLEAGLLMQRGYGGRSSKRYAKAKAYFEDCVAAGIPAAKSNLGLIYLEGKGTPSDPVKAEQLLLAAHAEGAHKAKLILARLYYNGQGRVARDREKARHFFELSAQAGITEAHYYLRQLPSSP